MKVKCPKCSASLTYDIATAGLKCAHCGTAFWLYDGPPEEGDYSTDDFLQRDTLREGDFEEDGCLNFKRLECSCCGADMLVGESETAVFCAFCGQPTLVFESVSRQQMPRFIAPFLIEKERAVSILRAKVRDKFFIAKDIKNFTVDKMHGVYVPFYRCDVDSDAEALIKLTQKNSKGIPSTGYYYRCAKNIYRDILVDGSSLLDRDSSLRVGPFDLSRLETFDPVYLAGFLANGVDEEIEETDYQLIKSTLEYMNYEMALTVPVKNKLKYTEMEPIKTNFKKIHILKQELIMLPIWFISFKRKDTVYTMMVNGQTGKCVGGVPVDKKRIAFSMVAVMAILTPIFHELVVFMLQSGETLKLIKVMMVTLFCASIGFLRFRKVKEREVFGRDINRDRFANERYGEGD